ncbi:MAG: DUF2157 domain-containing protein [Oligoflexia bacterium]|nr:DUF2157 domain-containing protein [Oligoflexia bacterium]
MSLKKRVNKWLAKGIITPDQATAIINEEKSRFSLTGKLRGAHGFLTVASFSIGLGVISLVAANWAVISADIKLFIYFLLMSCLSVLALKLKNKSELWFSALLILFMSLCLGGIGLIAQIYNLKGDSWQALLLWSVITSGLMLVSHKKITSHIWLGGFSVSLFLWSLSVGDLIALTGSCIFYLLFFLLYLLIQKKNIFLNQREALKPWTLVVGFYALLFFGFKFIAFSNHTIQEYSAGLNSIYLFFLLLFLSFMVVAPIALYRLSVLIYLWLIGLLFSSFAWISVLTELSYFKNIDLGSYFIFIYFLLFMFLSLLFRIPQITFPEFIKRNQSIFEKWTVVMGLINLASFNIIGKSAFFDENLIHITLSVFFVGLIFLFLCVNAYAIYYSSYKRIQKILLNALLSLYVLFFITVWDSLNDNSLINLIFSLLILLCSGFFAVSLKKESLFKLAIVALILRLYFFYVEVFQDLIHTGISLIVIGLFIVFLFVLFQKNKEKIMQWTKKLE